MYKTFRRAQHQDICILNFEAGRARLAAGEWRMAVGHGTRNVHGLIADIISKVETLAPSSNGLVQEVRRIQ